MNAPGHPDLLSPAHGSDTHAVLNQADPATRHNAFSDDLVLAAAIGREARPGLRTAARPSARSRATSRSRNSPGWPTSMCRS